MSNNNNNNAKMERRRRSFAAVSHTKSANVPSRPRTVTPSKQPDRFERQRSGSVPIDRVSMLVMEANEISECLGKDYHFSRNDDVVGGDQATVKVLNRRFSISTNWPLPKLKERLMKMRKLVYAGDAAGSGFSTESVFYDTNDEWKKEPVSAMYIDLSPGVTNGTDAIDAAMEELQKRSLSTASSDRAPELPKGPRSTSRQTSQNSRSFNGLSTGSSTSSELPAESEFIPTSSLTGPAKHPDIVIPQKYLTSGTRDDRSSRARRVSPHNSSSNSSTPHASPTHNAKGSVTSTSSHGYGLQPQRKLQLTPKKRQKDVAIQTDEISSNSDHKRVATLTLCKEMITMMIDRMRRQAENPHQVETLVDRILASCESVKMAVINILEAYTQAQESCGTAAMFADSDFVRVTSMQLVAALELLVSQTMIWMSMYEDTEQSPINSITQSVHESVRELAIEILTFIQGCEGNADDEAHHSSTRILELLYQLVKTCGQLALATDNCPVTSLRDNIIDRIDDLASLSSSTKDDDLIHMEPSSDLKQVFLSGADVFLDQSLETSLRLVETCETVAEGYTPDDVGAGKAEASSEVLKHVYIAVATSKLLVLKSQQIQVEVDGEMKEDRERPENYYLYYYWRCQGLLSHINRLSDSVSLLVQAAQPLSAEATLDPGCLMKVCRCSEMIQRNSHKLVTVSRGGFDDESHARCNLDTSINQSVISNSLTLDLTSLQSYDPDSSILSMKQTSELDSSGEDVMLATKALIDLCRRELEQFAGLEIKMKRMLPATPSNYRPIVRCRSARSANRRRLGRNLAELDISQDIQD